MSSLLEETKKFVDSRFKPGQLPHFERTLFWVRQLDPKADEAMEIAAYAHDIGRSVPEFIDEMNRRIKANMHINKVHEFHEIEGEKIMRAFLKEKGADSGLIEKVAHLVRYHDEGGDDDVNLLRDADSISFFETNVEYILEKRMNAWGKDFTRKKFDFMFNRIVSEQGKEAARPLYEKAISSLD